MPLNSEKIRKKLKNPVIIVLFPTVGSTNDEAKRGARNDAGAVLYAADSQSAGRGRRGRSFFSPPTGLYMTLSLPVHGETAEIQRMTCAAAVAVCDAVASLSGVSPSVKWVNDVYVDGKKVAGILAELVLDAENRPLRVIVGVGVNLTTDAFPAEFADRAGSIGATDPSELCAAITDNLIALYADLGDPALIERYKALNFCLGQEVAYTDRDGDHTATALDIAPDGSLIVDENGEKRSLHSGEISVKLR